MLLSLVVGPAGLAAAIYSRQSTAKTLLIEKGSYGGRINDTREIRNYPVRYLIVELG